MAQTERTKDQRAIPLALYVAAAVLVAARIASLFLVP